jgi:hypothetical protein
MKRHSIEGCYTHGVHLGLHRDFIVTGFFDKKIDVWRRRHTNEGIIKVQTVVLDSNVYVVKVNIYSPKFNYKLLDFLVILAI